MNLLKVHFVRQWRTKRLSWSGWHVGQVYVNRLQLFAPRMRLGGECLASKLSVNVNGFVPSSH